MPKLSLLDLNSRFDIACTPMDAIYINDGIRQSITDAGLTTWVIDGDVWPHLTGPVSDKLMHMMPDQRKGISNGDAMYWKTGLETTVLAGSKTSKLNATILGDRIITIEARGGLRNIKTYNSVIKKVRKRLPNAYTIEQSDVRHIGTHDGREIENAHSHWVLRKGKPWSAQEKKTLLGIFGHYGIT